MALFPAAPAPAVKGDSRPTGVLGVEVMLSYFRGVIALRCYLKIAYAFYHSIDECTDDWLKNHSLSKDDTGVGRGVAKSCFPMSVSVFSLLSHFLCGGTFSAYFSNRGLRH